jgi:hypothetical protein
MLTVLHKTLRPQQCAGTTLLSRGCNVLLLSINGYAGVSGNLELTSCDNFRKKIPQASTDVRLISVVD